MPSKTKLTIGEPTPKGGPSKIRPARPDDPIFTRGFVIGGQPPRKQGREPEVSAEAAALAKLIQSAPASPENRKSRERR